MTASAYNAMPTAATARMHRCDCCGQAVVKPRELGDRIEQRARVSLATDLDGCPAGLWRFIECLFDDRQPIDTVKQLQFALGLTGSTLGGRFTRRGLPAVGVYIQTAVLTRAAALFEMPGTKTLDVARSVGYCSAQSFQRAVSISGFGCVTEFRVNHTGESMLALFRARLIMPYRDVLLSFDPLAQNAVRRSCGGVRRAS